MCRRHEGTKVEVEIVCRGLGGGVGVAAGWCPPLKDILDSENLFMCFIAPSALILLKI